MNSKDDSAPLKPSNNIAWSLVTLFACCMPIGIVSLVYSMKVDTLYFQGKYEEAQNKADLAKKWAIGGLIGGSIFWIIYLISVVVLGFAGALF